MVIVGCCCYSSSTRSEAELKGLELEAKVSPNVITETAIYLQILWQGWGAFCLLDVVVLQLPILKIWSAIVDKVKDLLSLTLTYFIRLWEGYN